MGQILQPAFSVTRRASGYEVASSGDAMENESNSTTTFLLQKVFPSSLSIYIYDFIIYFNAFHMLFPLCHLSLVGCYISIYLLMLLFLGGWA